MINIRANAERPGGRRFWRHAGGLGLIGVIIALGLGAAFMSIGHDQRPREVPIAAVGTSATARAVEAQAPGQLSVRAVPDRTAARQAIAERDVYGAVVLNQEVVSELLIASAANNGVANFLRRTLGQPTPDGVPRITDVRPLPEDDATGIDILLLLQVLLIGGSIAVVGIGRLLPRFEGDPRRGVLPLTFLAGYAVLFGVALALISGAFGVGTDASFLDRVLAMALISAGVAASTAALVGLIGPAGSAVAGVLYFILGAQISGAGTAPEFLPSFWNKLGHYLPGGAGTPLLRDVFYFPEASTSESIAILAAYAGAGLLVLLGLNLIRARRRVPVTSASGTPVP
jgi:putative Mn2+ efflux pump MntP